MKGNGLDGMCTSASLAHYHRLAGQEGEVDRPDWDEYFVSIAAVVARRSDCLRRRAGAVIVRGRSIVSTGYDGTPMGVRNCSEGGCPSCAREMQPSHGNDHCLCVHAEANAILLAARHGTSIEGGVLYTTARPCFGCLKESIQAGIKEIVYDSSCRTGSASRSTCWTPADGSARSERKAR